MCTRIICTPAIGRKLLPALIEACAGAGFRQMIACIDAGNVPSLCLHEGFGFARIGELKGVGFKYGRWTDVDPCLPLLVADAKSPHTKKVRKQTLYALIAIVEDVKRRPEMYAAPRPLARAFATVPDMPQGYDLGALLDELCRLKLFAIEHDDNGVAALVPAEMASAKATQPKKKNLSTSMDWDVAEKVIALAKRRGTNASALIASAMADLVADA